MNRKLIFPIRCQWLSIAAHNRLNLIRDSWHKTAFRKSSDGLTHMQKYRLKFHDSSTDQDHPSEDKNHFSDHMERLIAAKTSNLGDKLHKLIITNRHFSLLSQLHLLSNANNFEVKVRGRHTPTSTQNTTGQVCWMNLDTSQWGSRTREIDPEIHSAMLYEIRLRYQDVYSLIEVGRDFLIKVTFQVRNKIFW